MPDGESNLEETNSGVKKKGDIEDIAKFARDVEKAMEEEDIEKDSVENFEKWRPRENDDKKDIEEKTVETATLHETEAEEKTDGVKKDLSKAGDAAKKAGKKLGNGKNPEEEIKKVPRRALRPLYSGSAKLARGFEKKIYSNVMVKFNPYFFDSKEFSANLKMAKDGTYTMDVNVPDENYRQALKGKFDRQ